MGNDYVGRIAAGLTVLAVAAGVGYVASIPLRGLHGLPEKADAARRLVQEQREKDRQTIEDLRIRRGKAKEIERPKSAWFAGVLKLIADLGEFDVSVSNLDLARSDAFRELSAVAELASRTIKEIEECSLESTQGDLGDDPLPFLVPVFMREPGGIGSLAEPEGGA